TVRPLSFKPLLTTPPSNVSSSTGTSSAHLHCGCSYASKSQRTSQHHADAPPSSGAHLPPFACSNRSENTACASRYSASRSALKKGAVYPLGGSILSGCSICCFS